MTSRAVLGLFLFLLTLLASLGVCIEVGLVELFEVLKLTFFEFLLGGTGIGKNFFELVESVFAELRTFREDNLEGDEEISEAEAVLEEGHTLTPNSAEGVGLDDLSGGGGDRDGFAVEPLDLEVESGEGLEEGDGAFDEEVSPFALEDGVFIDLDPDEDVSGLDARGFISLAGEFEVVVVVDTWFDGDFKFSGVVDYLLSLAGFAPFLRVTALALSLAVFALALEDLLHEALLDDFLDDTLALALGTLFDFLASLSVAVSAWSFACEFDLLDTSFVDVFEGDFEWN